MLGPLKFLPLFKNKIWGGNKIKTILKHDFSPLPNCGELWAISGVPGNESIVAEGPLEGNNLNELLEIYMSDLVGDKVHDIFQNEFPLLIKFLDANDWLSIQVHPDDELAKARGFERGKTEMWYVIQADNGAKLIKGFSQNTSRGEYLTALNDNTLPEILNYENTKEGDAFYIEAGKVHALGPGILLTEIQQAADITYRMYDWDRKDETGNGRKLHTDEAMEAIDFKAEKGGKIEYHSHKNQSMPMVDEKYFTTNIIEINQPMEKNYDELDSFVIYIITKGSFILKSEQGNMDLGIGDTVLLPAITQKVELHPLPTATLLEVFIKI
ncbi:MAG: class I mannose-6-phosphate isomerase [Bacteroidales bacterium]|nr:class I mannose-6-phosphate isomerase [Bacteroidales bacterium]